MSFHDDVHKILVIKLRAIGDVVMSTVVLANLRAAFPDAQIDFLTEAASQAVLRNNPVVHQVLILDRADRDRLASLKLLWQIRRRRYDLVFDYFGNPRSALITRVSGARWRVGYDYRIRQWAYNVIVPSRASLIHEVDWHLDALEKMSIPIISRDLSMGLDDADRHFAQQFLQQPQLLNKPLIALNFSGGWPAKRWPLDRFARLAEYLHADHKAALLIVWGPGEEAQARELVAQSRVPLTLLPPTDLCQLAAILEKMTLMVSTDSGPMHIAAAVGTPCVAIFGPTNPDLQGPYGPQHRVVRKSDLACLGCNRLDCDHLSCMQSLSVHDVLQAVRRCIKENDLIVETSGDA